MAKYDDIGGHWRTIGGRRVFIKDGQSLSSAMKESGKFNSSKQEQEKVKQNVTQEIKDYFKENDKDWNSDKEFKKYLFGKWGLDEKEINNIFKYFEDVYMTPIDTNYIEARGNWIEQKKELLETYERGYSEKYKRIRIKRMPSDTSGLRNFIVEGMLKNKV